jgi:hypothetical protein
MSTSRSSFSRRATSYPSSAPRLCPANANGTGGAPSLRGINPTSSRAWGTARATQVDIGIEDAFCGLVEVWTEFATVQRSRPGTLRDKGAGWVGSEEKRVMSTMALENRGRVACCDAPL